MVKSFFIGLGTTIFWVWAIWGIIVLMMHFVVGIRENWWGIWDWTAIVPIIFFALWGAGKVFVSIGENVRKGNW